MQKNILYLKELGLTEYQAKVLIALFVRDGLTAHDICRMSGVPYQKIYTVLKNLEYWQLVDVVAGKPQVYKSSGPEEVINILITRKLQTIKELRKEKKEQVKIIKKLDEEELETINKKPEKVHPVLALKQYGI